MGTDESDKEEKFPLCGKVALSEKERMQPPTYESPNHLKTQIEGKFPINDARKGKGNASEATRTAVHIPEQCLSCSPCNNFFKTRTGPVMMWSTT